MFKWTEDCSVKIDSIDEQHKELFRIGRKIESSIANYTGDDISTSLTETFDELIAYAQYHFKFEENLMKEAQYEGLVPHMHKHKKLISQVNNLRNSTQLDNQASSIFSLLQLVSEWTFEHIKGDDFSYINCLKSHANNQ